MTDPITQARMEERAFTKYRRSQIAELRPYVSGEVLSDRVSISAADREAGSPKPGDMIARNPASHDDQWLVAADYFTANFEALPLEPAPSEGGGSARPIPMILFCPAPGCGLQHIDAPEEGYGSLPGIGRTPDAVTTWTNPPHRSHLCHGCGHIWRPADVPTEGVAEIATKGKVDSPTVRGSARDRTGGQDVDAQDAPSPWRPIESAPKDGTPIIGGRFYADRWHVEGARWSTDFPRDEGFYVNGDGAAWWPTHWMPLPLPSTPTPTEGDAP